MKSPNKNDVLGLLDKAADIIRLAVPYECILLLLFYKVISDKWNAIVTEYIKEGYERKEAYSLANSDYLVLYDENEDKLYTWNEITKKEEMLSEIENALIKIAELNSTGEMELDFRELKRLIDSVGLSSLSKRDDLRPKLLDLITLFDKYDFSKIDYDIIGDAYQWLLFKFAPSKAKEGENYTPYEVIKLMVRLMDPEDHSIIVDPACGSAAMLIESYRYVKEKLNGEEPRIKLYGQDINEKTVAIAKINLLLHNIRTDVKILSGDSLINPEFLKNIEEKLNRNTADYAIANPPWNQKGYGEEKLGKPELKKIYKYGYPPNNSADWAWIQLLLYSAEKKAVVVIDQGALFRGGKEKKIRSEIVDKDFIEAVILLPEKLFFNTNAPGVIIVFNKNKPAERKGKILFINASNEYEPHPEVKKLNKLGEKHIEKIVKTYREFKDIEGFSKVVSLEDVKANDYNLNVTLYVTPPIETEEIDLEKELQELLELETQTEETMKKVLDYTRQIVQALKK